jgi:hypothetical protein
VGKSALTVNGNEIPSSPIDFSIQKSYQNASGPLIDCSNLLLENEDVCPGAEGHVCIVDSSILGESKVAIFEWELSNVAEENGCVAIVEIGGFGWHDSDTLAIPFILVDVSDRMILLKSEPNAVAQIDAQLFGTECSYNYFDCNSKLPCGEGNYCYFWDVIVDNVYTEGACQRCPTFDDGEPDPAGCFFDREGVFIGISTFSFFTPEIVISCSQACNATIASKGCKFCPSEISALEFGVEDKADQCYFCPNNDVQFPHEIVPLFGENITCRMVQTFFNRMEIHKDSSNCRLVQSMNYMCGCQGPGYAGANTHTKQVALVWAPRVAATLSVAVSLLFHSFMHIIRSA